MKKNKGLKLLIFVLVCVFLLYGCTTKGKDNKDTNQAAAQKQSTAQSESQTQSEKLAQAQTATHTEKQKANPSAKQTEKQSESQSVNQSQTSTEKATDGPLIVIDPGHQGPGFDMSKTEPIGPGSDTMKARIVTGTSGKTSGLNEYELALEISLMLEKELQNRGYRVIMTRTTNDIDISNIERAEIANKAGADAFVRIHANGDDNTSVDGALTMTPSKSNPYVGYMYDQCMKLSQCILDSYTKATGLKNRGVLELDDMTGINWSKVPVTIVEMGFMSNSGDDTYMADPANHDTMVKGIADGIDQYFGR